MKFATHHGPFAICRLAPASPVPDWAVNGPFYSVTRTPNELSIICAEETVPRQIKAERGFHCIKLEGALDFLAVGILESFLAPLAQTGVPIFAVSTYDTDWILIHKDHWDKAMDALVHAGHQRVS